MNTPKNSRRRVRASKPARRGQVAGRLRTAAIALVLGCLSAVGLWRCLDDGGRSVMGELAQPEPAVNGEPVAPRIDVGQGLEPDPTLVNEQALLDSEEPDEAQIEEALTARSIPDAPPPDAVEEERILARYPLHAVAYHFHAQVFAKRDRDSRVAGYARRGATFRVGERSGTDGCPRGWHEIRGGGFICDGLGFNVGREPLTFSPAPPAPRVDEALPYDYQQIRSGDTPQYWRIPTPEEQAETAAAIARISGAKNGASQETSQAEAAKEQGSAELDRVLARAASMAADAGIDEADAGPEPAPVTVPREAATPAEIEEPLQLPAYVHMRMNRGFYVSVDEVVLAEDGASFTRTVRSRFVPSAVVASAQPSEFEGVLIDEETPLPVVFVVGSGASLLERKGDNGPLVQKGTAERYHKYPLLERIRHNGRSFLRVGENLFLAQRVAAVADRIDPPRNLLPGERWIAIDLTRQTLVAYEGETPVFATLVATGRKEYPTPTGEFRVYGKHVSVNMADTDAGDESYSIEDVPWTQYYQGGYALHAAFWHDRFGRVRSHGCVNLSPADARRLFYWTGPVLASGLHGAIATGENPGTRIVVHD